MIVRLARFLGERFGDAVVPTLLWMGAVHALTCALAGAPVVATKRMLLGFFTALLVNACTRTTDEIKDVEVDKVYFPQRPLVTGRVTVREVYGLTFFMAALVVVANVLFPFVLGYAALLLVLLFLMATWYFVPGVLSKNRVLAIASNCPVYFTVCLQQGELAAQTSHAPPAVPYAVAALMMLPFLSFEFARKTFLPAGERAGYQSYSALLGLRAATLVGFALAALHLVALFAAHRAYGVRAASLTLAGLALSLAVYGAFAAGVLLGKRVPARALELSSGAYFVVGLIVVIAPGVIAAVRS